VWRVVKKNSTKCNCVSNKINTCDFWHAFWIRYEHFDENNCLIV
jgi:DNA modification methylase